MPAKQFHHAHRTGWLRAAVMGANDGTISTTSLLFGIAAAHSSHGELITAGVAGLVAGAMAMAAGEFVSVSSQADAEQADLRLERQGLLANSLLEHQELAAIYVKRGLDAALAAEVANQLMAFDALGAHAREELGISEFKQPRPFQAAWASALSFAAGAALPLLTAFIVPSVVLIPALGAIALVVLSVLGSLAAYIGGANLIIGTLRVLVWGAVAMGVTASAGAGFAFLF
jgi:VIT1/CCC1 family predicted Fe2+/Mn2+ transporter